MIDLQSFCAKDDARSYLQAPFVLDGYTCATNGHVLVRVAGGEPDPEQKLPAALVASVQKLFATEYTDHEPLPALPELRTCPDCKGAGTLANAECSDCNGLGWFDHGQHEYECKECDGDGVVAERDCNNHNCRDGELFDPMQIGPAHFDVRYLHRIAQLPGVRFKALSSAAIAAFVFDGGEGRLMPCRT